MSRRRSIHVPLALDDRLVLFWEVAQPLRRVVEGLPAFGKGPKMTLTFSLEGVLQGAQDLPAVLQAASESRLEVEFKNVSEPLFERLALRFRPFYASEEPVNFLFVIGELVRVVPSLKEWHGPAKSVLEGCRLLGKDGHAEHNPFD